MRFHGVLRPRTYSAYAAVPAAAALLASLAAPNSPAAPAGWAPGPATRSASAPVSGTPRSAAAAGPPSPVPGLVRGFDEPYRRFAPPGTLLERSTPAAAGLDPAPIRDFERRVDAWTDPANASRGPDGGYLFPSAASLMAHDGRIVQRRAAGDATAYSAPGRRLPPGRRTPARPSTVYDLASLSKLFTSIVAVQQIEDGRIGLHAPVARYLPGFAVHGKSRITVEQLLTHTSGLPADPHPALWRGHRTVPERRRAVLRTVPQAPPGRRYIYSDLNMLTLQQLVEKVTGRRLDALVRRGITAPLRMRDTGYRPPAAERPRTAATAYERPPANPDRGLVHGAVQDPNAWAMGGVAGHAGVFSTVDDLAVLAQTLLNGGSYGGRRILPRHGVALLERNRNRAFPGDAHALGFELNQDWYMGGLSGPATLGHTGFAGTSLVIDPRSRSFAILLTNRVHPSEQTPSTNPARRAVAQALARAIPVAAPGGGRAWSAGGPENGPGGAGGAVPGRRAEATLSTGRLRPKGAVRIGFSAFVDTDPGDRLAVEASTDGGRTWRRLPFTVAGPRAPRTAWLPVELSGHRARAWWRVRARLPAREAARAGRSPAGLRLRWRYTTGTFGGSRGVDVAGVLVTDPTRLLLAGDCPNAPLTARGWRALPGPWRFRTPADRTPGRCPGTPASAAAGTRAGPPDAPFRPRSP